MANEIFPGDVVRVSKHSASMFAGAMGIVTEVGYALARVYFNDKHDDRAFPISLLTVVSPIDLIDRAWGTDDAFTVN
jgi:hypothetical protein